MMADQVRVFDKDSLDSVWLAATPNGLELTVDQGDGATVTLSVRGVRTLRLALARYEREHTQSAVGASD